MTSRRALLAVLTLALSVYEGSFEFTVSPMVPENVSVNEDVVFHCSHSTADTIGWLINGSSLGSNPPDDIMPSVKTLTIIALPKYNNTEIQCVAVYFDGVTPIERSDPVTLIIPDACGSREVSTAVRSFIEVPMSQNVPEGVEVRFRCRHRATNTLLWEVDGVLFNESSTLNATTFAVPIDGGTSRHVLLFDAILSYHHTSIVCAAVFSNGCPQQTTMPALLLIQGPLRAISGVFRGRLANQEEISYFWEPPPTLDLTGVEPDIVYCVEVYNITCEADNLIATECELTNPVYPASVGEGLNPNFVYNITVVPRSNVPGAANGAVFTKQEEFMSVKVFPKAVVKNSAGIEIEFGVFINDTEAERLVKARARSYSIEIEAIDDPQASVSVLFNDNAETITVVLPERQRWTYSTFAYGCQLHPVSVTKEMSTHAVQNISLTSGEPGELTVTGDFITNTSALGMLAIVYSTINDSDIHYTEARLPQTEISLTGLSGNSYSVSAFDIEENGLPFNITATSPKEIAINRGNVLTQTEASVEYEVQESPSCVRVTCTFLDSSTTDCVAVVHQRISQLSSSGLMNIESSHKFNRSGDTAYGCIEGVNLTDYQVGVVNGKRLTPLLPTVQDVEDSSSSVCIECIIGSVAGVLVFVAIVALIVVIVFFSFKYYTTKSKKVLNIVAIGQVHVDQGEGGEPVSQGSPLQDRRPNIADSNTTETQATVGATDVPTIQSSPGSAKQTADDTKDFVRRDSRFPAPLHSAANNSIFSEGPLALSPPGSPSRERVSALILATKGNANDDNGSTTELQAVSPIQRNDSGSSTSAQVHMELGNAEASGHQSSSTDKKDTGKEEQLNQATARPPGDGQEDTREVHVTSETSSAPPLSKLIVTPPGISSAASSTDHSKNSEETQVTHGSQVVEGGLPSAPKLFVDKNLKHEVVDTPAADIPQNKVNLSDDSQSKSPFKKIIPVRSSAMPTSIASRKHPDGISLSPQEVQPPSDDFSDFPSIPEQSHKDDPPLELDEESILSSSKERKMSS